jgi:hypothetical protein
MQEHDWEAKVLEIVSHIFAVVKLLATLARTSRESKVTRYVSTC